MKIIKPLEKTTEDLTNRFIQDQRLILTQSKDLGVQDKIAMMNLRRKQLFKEKGISQDPVSTEMTMQAVATYLKLFPLPKKEIIYL